MDEERTPSTKSTRKAEIHYHKTEKGLMEAIQKRLMVDVQNGLMADVQNGLTTAVRQGSLISSDVKRSFLYKKPIPSSSVHTHAVFINVLYLRH